MPSPESRIPNTDLRGKCVLLMGLGNRQGGLGVARYLVEAGAEVRVTDLRDEVALAATLADLSGLPITYTLGRHLEEDFRWAEVVVRNPAVPRESPWLALARDLGKRIEMEMTLFFRACPAPILGVTGTKGKTTTSTLLGQMLRERWPDAVLAGNMAVSALGQLASMRPDTPVALELSSFQLEALDEQHLSPHVAVITNISPDHLDRYESFDDYAWVKGAVARHQTAADWLVVPDGDQIVDRVVGPSNAHKVTFGAPPVILSRSEGPLRANDTSGEVSGGPSLRLRTTGELRIAAGRFTGIWNDVPIDLGPTDALRLPGDHSRLNALAAAAAALAIGVTPEEIARAIAGFTGVPHRMEHVATIGGVDYINDTAATAPAAAVAALRAFEGREIVAIAGGFDKKLPIEPLVDALVLHAQRVVLLDGTLTPTLHDQLANRGHTSIAGPFGSMDEAVRQAATIAQPGSIVLLSPGTASFGMFRDEFHRGEAFRAAVAELQREVSE
ncbi:MAG TPA: UDP-N-acetylmuramoyl-L-alanine--D-glutamate ligase [Thermomicrobiales bacterium]|nr:UDP-N-acetylmuramoyl-L-alanine--D-glutamate ligase [Thermomicrobiales bacterium]